MDQQGCRFAPIRGEPPSRCSSPVAQGMVYSEEVEFGMNAVWHIVLKTPSERMWLHLFRWWGRICVL